MTRANVTMSERRGRARREDGTAAETAADAVGREDAARSTVTVHVPIAFQQRRGRKVLVAPDGAGQDPLSAPQPPARSQRQTTSAVRALARAFRWRSLLETGAVATVHEIAAAENINSSYVSRVLRLTLLAPEILEAFMAGGSRADMPLERMMLPFPVEWQEQTSLFSDHPPAADPRMSSGM